MGPTSFFFLKATKAGWRAWLHTLIVEYLRTLVSWSLRPKRRGKRGQRTLMAVAICDFLLGRVGEKSLGQANEG